MTNKEKQQRVTEDILNSLDNMQKAEAPAFFYTRLQARMEREAEPASPFWQWVTKPVFAMATLSLLILLNVAAINSYRKTNMQEVVMEANGIQGFAQEYQLTVSSVYMDKSNR